MKFVTKILIIKFIFFINFCVYSFSLADNHNIYEIIEQLQKDIKTLEKAVYSGSIELNSTSVNNSNSNSSNNSEDVLQDIC